MTTYDDSNRECSRCGSPVLYREDDGSTWCATCLATQGGTVGTDEAAVAGETAVAGTRGGVTPPATMKRAMRPGYREHDSMTDWQECDTCHVRLGRGLTTRFDAAYYAGDPDACPRPDCTGRMGLPVDVCNDCGEPLEPDYTFCRPCMRAAP